MHAAAFLTIVAVALLVGAVDAFPSPQSQASSTTAVDLQPAGKNDLQAQNSIGYGYGYGPYGGPWGSYGYPYGGYGGWGYPYGYSYGSPYGYGGWGYGYYR